MTDLAILIDQARSRHLDRKQCHAAFAELVKQFQPVAFACAYATLRDTALAQDATQEAFISAYQNLDQLREARAFPGWLKRIVLTQCHRLQRKKQVPTTPIEATETVPTIELDPATTLEADELQSKILAAIDALPEHERDVVRLFYLQGYSIKEVSKSLQLPITTIKKRLQYARRRLRKTVAEAYGITMLACQAGLGSTLNTLVELTLVWVQPQPFQHMVLSRVRINISLGKKEF